MITERKTTRHQLQRLLPRHHKILELALAGHNNAVIADTLDMTTRAISIILQSPLAQSELKRRRENTEEVDILRLDRDAHLGKVRSFMEQEAETAAETIVGLMASSDENLQLRSAKEILDRVFGKPDGGKTNGAVNISITGDQAQLLILALKESPNGEARIQPANGGDSLEADEGHGAQEGGLHQASKTEAEHPRPGAADALDQELIS